MTAFEVCGYNAAIPLLSSSVPNEEFNVINLLWDAYIFKFKVNSCNFSFVLLVCITLCKFKKKCWFSNSRITNKYDFIFELICGWWEGLFDSTFLHFVVEYFFKSWVINYLLDIRVEIFKCINCQKLQRAE